MQLDVSKYIGALKIVLKLDESFIDFSICAASRLHFTFNNASNVRKGVDVWFMWAAVQSLWCVNTLRLPNEKRNQ